MSLRAARLLASSYFLIMAVAVVWPVATVASRIEPMVLGLPFSFFWPVAWVAVSVPVLYALDRVEQRHRNHRGATGGDA